MILPRYFIECVELPAERLGSWYDTDGKTLIAKTLELPWRNNAVSDDPLLASCIPYGIFLLVLQPAKEERPYEYYRFVHVPGRNWHPDTRMSSILAHPITFVENLRGCVGVGSRFEDLNKDGVPDIVESKKKLKWMTSNMPRAFELEIKPKPI